jgi:hypothetical protein
MFVGGGIMWRKFLTIGVVFVFGMIFQTQSTWPWDDDTETSILMETWENDLEPHPTKEWKDHKGKASMGPPAPCEQLEDLEGKWTVRVGSWDESGRHCWARCRIKIDRGGIIQQGIYIDCDGKTKSKITGGQLGLSPGCLIIGKIETSDVTLYVDRGAILGGHLALGLAADQENELMRDEIETDLRLNFFQWPYEDITGVLKRLNLYIEPEDELDKKK